MATYLDALRQLQCPRETAELSLAHRVPILIGICGRLALARDGEMVVMDADIYILFLEPGELEGRRQSIFAALMEVHPV